MDEYVHTVQYYETDKMGVTHHSNYIRWMEEARVDFLARAGWDYKRLEDMGIVSAVVSVSCEFKRPTTFSDRITVYTRVTEFKGIVLVFGYEMKDAEGATVCTGTTSHAFLNSEGRPLSIRKKYPEIYEAFCRMTDAEG
jgi:acyl-CoA thioester hydrolase